MGGRSIFIFTLFFFFNDTATTEIYTLSLHDALPISKKNSPRTLQAREALRSVIASLDQRYREQVHEVETVPPRDRKSTRLNSSHGYISYAVFCLKKKTNDVFQEYDPVAN